MRRVKIMGGGEAIYHCMSRTVNGECLFEDREKEVLRRMITQVADFSGVELLTHCLMGNHFHLLVRIPVASAVSDVELMRRYRVLYPKPTKHQAASADVITRALAVNSADGVALRAQLLARMGDVSEFMKTLKQRFSTWFNKSHRRFGPLWADRFKSVLVEPNSNALRTMAAYIDLNPVRAGLGEDPKDYRFCAYAEAVAGSVPARRGIAFVLGNLGEMSVELALSQYRMMLFGKGTGVVAGKDGIDRKAAVRVLEVEHGELSQVAVLRCRVRYFTDGAILGSREFVLSHLEDWQRAGKFKLPPKVLNMKGSDWGGLAVIHRLRRSVFS